MQNYPLDSTASIAQNKSTTAHCDDAVREEEVLLKQRYVDPLFQRCQKSDTKYAVEIHGMRKRYRSKGPFRPKEESALEENWFGIRTGNYIFVRQLSMQVPAYFILLLYRRRMLLSPWAKWSWENHHDQKSTWLHSPCTR
jgi:hypothetical protein